MREARLQEGSSVYIYAKAQSAFPSTDTGPSHKGTAGTAPAGVNTERAEFENPKVWDWLKSCSDDVIRGAVGEGGLSEGATVVRLLRVL